MPDAQEKSDALLRIINIIDDALSQVSQRAAGGSLKVNLKSAELEVKVVRRKGASAGGELPFLPVELSGKHKRSEVQTFILSMIPRRGTERFGKEAEELADSIIAMARTIDTMRRNMPNWKTETFTIVAQVEIEKEGGFKVVVGGEGHRGSAHTIKLLFEPEP